MSPIPPISGGMPPPFFFSGFPAISASVVSSSEATLAAFCSALRTTLVGSSRRSKCRWGGVAPLVLALRRHKLDSN